MKVMIVGGGGREHALAWKAARSPNVQEVFVAPGNAGTALETGTTNVDIGAEDLDGLLEFAIGAGVNLTIVGPEAPLVAGLVDQFTEAGLRCFGPTSAGAQLEGSKAFTKAFLVRCNIPTAAYRSFTDAAAAVEYIQQQGAPIVVKADGLAAGKGVIIAQTIEEACAAAEAMLTGESFGDAGRCVVVEEFLRGEEASFTAMVDGSHILPLATSQDHKARDDGDRGPNTGGMGAYSPAPVITRDRFERIMQEVIEPTVHGLADDGSPYVGFLYAGLMIGDDDTPRVLEFNVRFGDPEIQPILMRLKSDLVELCEAALDGRLHEAQIEWDDRAALGVVMAAGGYPESYRKGDRIDGLPKKSGTDRKVFHAGTRLEGETVLTAGGRVLCNVALGETVTQAQRKAYELTRRISWPDAYYRTDIGYRAVAREESLKTED